MFPDRQPWDEERAQVLVGALVLVGMTYAADEDRLEQVFGIITSAQADRGFELMLQGSREGEVFRLPPDIEAFHPAPPGVHRLKTTQEIVENPDFTATWTVYSPQRWRSASNERSLVAA